MNIAEGLAAYMAESSGAVHIELRGASDEQVALRAMNAAKDALYEVPHPEEPDDPLSSFSSDVAVGERGPAFWFDIADAEAEEGLIDSVIEALAAALNREGADGMLAWPEAP